MKGITFSINKLLLCSVNQLTWQWKMYSGDSFWYFMFHISATPSGSWGASSLLLYEATNNSGYWKTIMMQYSVSKMNHYIIYGVTLVKWTCKWKIGGLVVWACCKVVPVLISCSLEPETLLHIDSLYPSVHRQKQSGDNLQWTSNTLRLPAHSMEAYSVSCQLRQG